MIERNHNLEALDLVVEVSYAEEMEEFKHAVNDALSDQSAWQNEWPLLRTLGSTPRWARDWRHRASNLRIRSSKAYYRAAYEESFQWCNVLNSSSA